MKVRENCHPFPGPSEAPRAPVSTCERIRRIVKWPPSFSPGCTQMLNNATCMKHGPRPARSRPRSRNGAPLGQHCLRKRRACFPRSREARPPPSFMMLTDKPMHGHPSPTPIKKRLGWAFLTLLGALRFPIQTHLGWASSTEAQLKVTQILCSTTVSFRLSPGPRRKNAI